MSKFSTRKSRDKKFWMKTYKKADEFAIETFIELRKDDSCWKRFLRFFRIIEKQKV